VSDGGAQPGQIVPPVEQVLATWARRVRANREQVDRFREVEDGADFYAPIATRFREDPRRQDEPALEALRALVRRDETWLDIGAGGGRYSLPIALLACEVIALDPSSGMLAVLREGMTEHQIPNVRIIQARWPATNPPRADVAFISHVGYDIEAIGPFLDAMEAAASRMCVAVFFQQQPTRPFDALWPEVHGEARSILPALPEFLTVLLARGRLFELRLVERTAQSYGSIDEAVSFAHRQTWVLPGGEKDRRLREAVARRLEERNGRFAFSWEPNPIGIVTWQPR
jgi:SAM-dependent methyltransferase